MTKRDLILRTKLQPPKIKGKVLRRERLIRSLEESLHKKLILICAGAGYGKTTLLAQFCEEFNRPYVYYDIDAKDNDLATFLNYLISGIRKYSADFGRRIKSIIPHVRETEIVIGTFINEFTERIKKNFYIILDDYHHLQKNAEVAKNLDYLLRYMPDNLHIIIASRSTPPLNLSYYSSKQELFQIEKDSLQFTIKELESLLKNIYGLTLPKSEITRIAEHSEGWVTAIQLILQKIYAVGEKTTEEAINSYLASGEELFNYFAREVFECQPKRIREFLIRTSIFDFLTPETANYLLKIRVSKRILGYLETQHIFVSRIGDKFKFHPLFREFLNKRLADYYPSDTIKNLHKKIGNYFFRIGDLSNAVNHLLIAENYPRAADILSRHYAYWGNSGHFENYIQLIERFPKAVAEKYPYLLLKKIRPLLYLGEPLVVLKLLGSISQKFRRTKDRRGSAEAHYLTGYVYLTLLELDRARRFMKRAYQLVGPRNSILRVEILLGFATVFRNLGRYRKTEDYLNEARRMAQRLRNIPLEIRVIRSLAYLFWAASDYKRADEIYSFIFSRFKDRISEFELGKIYSNAALIALNNNNISRALTYLGYAEKIAGHYNDQRTINFLTAVKGEYHMFRGECEKALELFEMTMELNKKFNERILDYYALIDMVDVYLKMGRIAAAQTTLKKVKALLSENVSPHPMVEYLLLKGRIEDEQARYNDALDSFNQAQRLVRRIDQPEQEMLVHYAMGEHFLKCGRDSDALKHLKKCLLIAQAFEYNAALITEGRYDLRLIEFGLARNLYPEYLTTILKKIDTEETRSLLSRMNAQRGVYDLECNLFGVVGIKQAGGNILRPRWRTKKTESLFCFLIVNQGQRFSSGQLIDMLWPKKGAREAVHSLQVEISYIRNILKRFIKSGIPAKNLILFQNRKYFLNPALVIKTDVADFEARLRRAQTEEAVNHSRSRRFYQDALRLYRGDFCEDVADDWCEDTRLHFKKQCTEVFKRLGQLNFADRRYKRSLEFYSRAGAIDPLDESIHLGILKCYVVLKDRAGLQRQYRILTAALKKIGLSKPSPEIEKVFQQGLNPS